MIKYVQGNLLEAPRTSECYRMSEYTAVEQPFLHQLASLDWQIIDQGTGIPQNPVLCFT